LCQELATLYSKHKYIYENFSNDDLLNISRFNQIYSGILNNGITKNALLYLSDYLKNYYKSKCIVLIDEYDHPFNIAYHYQYYDKARDFFATVFEGFLKVSTYFKLFL
jgi:hypothetical protein